MILNDKHILTIKLKKFLSSNLVIIFCYTLLALFFTFPLILNFNDGIPGGGEDATGGLWILWLYKYNLIDLQRNILDRIDLLFYPVGFNISNSYDNLLIVFLSFPLQIIFKNLFTVYNTLIIFNFVFSSYTTYLLIKYLTNDKKISFLAGIMFGFSPYMFARSLGHMNLLTTGAIPLFILSYFKFSKNPSLKNSLIASISLLLISLSSWHYGLYILFFIIFSQLFLLFTSKKNILNKQYLINFVIFIILSIILILPFALPMISSEANNTMYPTSEDLEYIVFSADVASYLLPTPSNTLFGKFIEKDYFKSLGGNITESTIYLGIFEIIFIIDFLLTHKNKFKKNITENSHWIVMFFVFLILSFGPQLKIGGYLTNLVLPYYFIYKYIPFFNFAKEPVRMGIFVMLFTTIVFSVFLKAYLSMEQKKIKTNLLLLFFVIIIIAERAELPFPVEKIKIPSFYNKISEEKENYAILDIPSNIRRNQQSSYDFYQTIHKKKIIVAAVGYTSFSSNSYSWIEQNNFVLESGCYTQEEKKEMNINNPTTNYDKNKVLREFKDVLIKYVIVHKDIIANLEKFKTDEKDKISCQRVKDNINELFKNTPPIFEDEQITVYQLY